jgi:hypothetical protein
MFILKLDHFSGNSRFCDVLRGFRVDDGSFWILRSFLESRFLILGSSFVSLLH